MIEQFGPTRSYYAFRKVARDYYRSHFKLTAQAASTEFLNPGNCWVAHFSFEPKVGVDILRLFLAPLVESGKLRIFYKTAVTNCSLDSHHKIKHVTCRSNDQGEIEFRPKYVLDATDLGDVLPLAGKEGQDWVTGAESKTETGEPDAPDEARPDWVQPFTFPFALDWSPETKDSNCIAKPEDYEALKSLQKYHIKHGAITGLFAGAFSWWAYRRLLAAENFADERIKNDLAMINTAGNDFYGGNIIGSDAGDEPKIQRTLTRLGECLWAMSIGFRLNVRVRMTLPEAPLAIPNFACVSMSSIRKMGLQSSLISESRAASNLCEQYSNTKLSLLISKATRAAAKMLALPSCQIP